jgi:deazaflavin-dependent oxidoreductase (nitroreductase family)
VVIAATIAIVGYIIVRCARQTRPGRSGDGATATSSPGVRDRAFIRFAPAGWLRIAFQLPAVLYRLGLGWLFGHRLLMLTHRGRKSGRAYQTILEVVHYDPSTRESIVVSGWGERADWYRNILARPPLEVQTGRERYVPLGRVLSVDEAYTVLVDYERRLPWPARPLARRLGFTVEGDEAVRREHAASLLMIAFRPPSAWETSR